MSLRRQLLLVLSILFLLLLLAIQWASLTGTKRFLETQLASHAQDAATALSITLAQSLGKDDAVLAEAQINSVFDRGYFREVHVLRADRTSMVSKELPEKIEGVPIWFSHLLPIETATGEAHITAGWRQLGKVLVVSQPTFAYQYLWRSAIELSGWIVALFICALVLMQGLLRLVLKPLLRIEESAIAVQQKRFEQIDSIPRAPELGRVVRAMNDMSRRVSEMLDAETERAEGLRKKAYEDEMTGIANRAGFELRLTELLAGDLKFDTAAVIAIDLNDMRIFNRSHGFRDGQALMQGITRAAHEALGGKHWSLMGHINEYSFSYVLVDLPNDDVAQRVARFREMILGEIARSPAAGEVSFCMGVAWFHQGYSRSEVFSRADLAVESSRQAGRNAVVTLPDKRDDTSALGSFGWRMLIQNALKENRWLLVSQPVVRLADRTVMLHAEMMARLIDEKAQLVPASQFLPMAARHQLMPEIDRALVTLGLEYAAVGGVGREQIALNMSPQGVANRELVSWLGGVLGGLKGAATHVSIELSEFACLRNIEAAQRAMELVRKHGAKFGIDNFGVDPQALKLLRQIPPDYIKLSGGLIADIATNNEARNLVMSIVQLAKSLEVLVLAQNIENEAQVAALIAAGVEGGQGYLFGAPV
jgi:diguanylate cyclase (GGDEF)-like protein